MLGIVVADHVCEPISHVPCAGELVLTPRTHLSIGGCAANVAVDLVRLGRKAAIVGRVGDDPFGRFLIDSLKPRRSTSITLPACRAKPPARR